ncbi:hypothetical protein D9758_013256 [Tetrapyrgos nigripes]|uniref:Anti-proliferative protein domain-containing protein n=1 Tax=Tetrapyrgos nigripes TaxID=182062 RepID=A0A8H5CMB4_9AGAR|nr:hypothetical protein D9758_013256 [Tetrapyrgos nigripes]
MSSTTLTQLINLLTRPLIFTHPAITVAQLQLALQANLAVLFNLNEGAFAPFTLHLSPHALPIPPLYAACLSLGMSWESWVGALSGGKDLYVFVMKGCIRVGVPNMRETITVWSEDESAAKASAAAPSSTTTSKLQAMLHSARARKQAQAPSPSASAESASKPTLHITPSTPSNFACTMASEPSSPTSSTTSDDAYSTDSESDADGDSDTESTTSSTFSSRSDGVSSVSSVSSSPVDVKPEVRTCSNAFGTPFLQAKVPTSVSVSGTRTQRRRDWASPITAATTASPKAAAPAALKANPSPVMINKSKIDVTKYTYQGGQTGVMTGGVMLGGAKAATRGPASGATKTQTQTQPTKKASASASGNWRRRV